jgi:RNA polymerase II subunit A-like phosphatase
MSKWEKEDETPYLVHVSESDRKRAEGEPSSPPSIQDSEDSEDIGGTGSEGSDDDEESSLPNSQESANIEHLMPDDFEEGHSPIDDLKQFDWGSADKELEEFMGDYANESDSEASDTGSVNSTSSRQSLRQSRIGDKRKYDEATDDDNDSDEESTLAKKQRIANSRTTGLKTVKTPNSENSLPTPGPTSDGQDGDDDITGHENDDGDDDDLDDLEKDLMEELEREEAAEAAGDDGGG